MNTREKVIECLSNVGILIDDQQEDVNVNEYDIDSITFISFIVEIENEFGIVIPDGYLYAEILQSLNGFVSFLDQLIENLKTN